MSNKRITNYFEKVSNTKPILLEENNHNNTEIIKKNTASIENTDMVSAIVTQRLEIRPLIQDSRKLPIPFPAPLPLFSNKVIQNLTKSIYIVKVSSFPKF